MCGNVRSRRKVNFEHCIILITFTIMKIGACNSVAYILLCFSERGKVVYCADIDSY